VKENKNIILWRFQAGEKFGFFIPDDREYYGWDFFVNKNNFWWAVDWDLVKVIEVKSKWKKPEAKIISIKGQNIINTDVYVEWIYSTSLHGEYGFIDKIWSNDWIFVNLKNKNEAVDWDLVKAKVKKNKWKQEWTIVKILDDDFVIIKWKYKNNWEFGFVIGDNKDDIFIPTKWAKKAITWDNVTAKILDETWRRPLWIIIKIEKK